MTGAPVGSASVRRSIALGAGALAFVLAIPLADAADIVRVLLAEGRPAATIGSTGRISLTDVSGRRILAQRLSGQFRLVAHRGAVVVRETDRSASGVIARAEDGALITLDGQPFRGRLFVQVVNGGLVVVNWVELEEYLQGVLKDEIPPAWPVEAAKAVAVAARTYAVYQRFQNPDAHFHLRATTASQVYGGARGEDPRTNWAVRDTRGQILTFGGQPLPAFYHSCSGGATEDGNDVFGLAYDIVPGVRDDYSLGCPYILWVEQLTPKQIEGGLTAAGHRVGRVLAIQDLIRSRTGRIMQIEIRHTEGALVLEGRRFREAMGNEVLRSTGFHVRAEGNVFTFVGRGSGHGVGLSQWGAKEMADLAFPYHRILKFYYPLAGIGLWPK